MNIKEIIKKDELSQEEMIFVVEEFIWEKKQKRVSIVIYPDIFTFTHQINLLHKAFNYAKDYYAI